VEREKARERRRQRLAAKHGELYANQTTDVQKAMRQSRRIWADGPDPERSDHIKDARAEAADAGLTVMPSGWAPHHAPSSISRTREQRFVDARKKGRIDPTGYPVRELDEAADEFLAEYDTDYGDGTYFTASRIKTHLPNEHQHGQVHLPSPQTA